MPEATRQVVLSDRAAISSALEDYLQAFMKAAANGGGAPDTALVQAGHNVRMSQKAHQDVETAVWLSLDAVIGWDFQYPTKDQRADGFFGNLREVDGIRSSRAIIDAVRRGLQEALKSGDSNSIAAPLEEFWAKNPNYRPSHVGRCYPHGHEDIRDMKAGIACQIDILQRVSQTLIDRSNAAGIPGN